MHCGSQRNIINDLNNNNNEDHADNSIVYNLLPLQLQLQLPVQVQFHVGWQIGKPYKHILPGLAPNPTQTKTRPEAADERKTHSRIPDRDVIQYSNVISSHHVNSIRIAYEYTARACWNDWYGIQ